jgi:hypothetical protein
LACVGLQKFQEVLSLDLCALWQHCAEYISVVQQGKGPDRVQGARKGSKTPDFSAPKVFAQLLLDVRRLNLWEVFASHVPNVINLVKVQLKSGLPACLEPYDVIALFGELEGFNCQLVQAITSAASKQLVKGDFPKVKPTAACPSVLKIAFVGSDWDTHPTLDLMLQSLICLKSMEQSRGIKIFVVWLVKRKNDAYTDGKATKRLHSSVGYVIIETHDKTGKAITAAKLASTIRSMDVDVVVDCNGLTDRGRQDIIALRPAKLLQLAMVACPFTFGPDYIDFHVVDRVVMPPEIRHHQSGKMVYLECYQPNSYEILHRDSDVTQTLSRADFGLSDEDFVIAVTVPPGRVSPQFWSTLCDILKLHNTPKAVKVWLFADQQQNINVLKAAAVRLGVDREQLVFSPRVYPKSLHVQRLRLADFCLDPFYHGGHTAAADALEACLVMISLAGDFMAGKVGATLLADRGVNELVCSSVDAYVELALKIIRNDEYRIGLQERIAKARNTPSQCERPPLSPAEYATSLVAAIKHVCSNLDVARSMDIAVDRHGAVTSVAVPGPLPALAVRADPPAPIRRVVDDFISTAASLGVNITDRGEPVDVGNGSTFAYDVTISGCSFTLTAGRLVDVLRSCEIARRTATPDRTSRSAADLYRSCVPFAPAKIYKLCNPVKRTGVAVTCTLKISATGRDAIQDVQWAT